MPYERKQEALERLIERALSQTDVHEAVDQYGLSESRLSQQILGRQEEVWNAAGSEIENYNRAEAADSAAVANGQQQLDNWVRASRLFARIPSLASDAARIRLQGRAKAALYVLVSLMMCCFVLAAALYFGLHTAIGPPILAPSDKDNWLVRIGIALVGLLILSVTSVIILNYLKRFDEQLGIVRNKLGQEHDLANLRAATQAAAKAIQDAALKNGILPILRELINKSTGPSYATSFPKIEPRGLDQLHDLFFQTGSWGRLTNMLQTMNGGSIGLAGPRGAGKTTILRWFCGERSWTLRNREVLSVLVPAPADYEARDFILYLYYAVCRRVLQIKQVDVEQIRWHGNSAHPKHPILLYRYSRLYLLSFGTFFLILGLGTAAMQSVPGFAHLFRASGVYAAQTRAVTHATDNPVSHSGQPSANQPPAVAGQHQDDQLSKTAVAASTGAPLTNGELVARTLIAFEAALGLTASRLFFGGVLLLLGYSGITVWIRRSLLLREAAPGDLDKMTEDPLLADAVRRLQMIKFQQTYTEGWSGTLKFPVAEGGVKRDTSLSERSLSLPEIVASFSSFLERLAHDYWVLIGIDELDKIHPEEKAEKFLNDIKIVFGLRGVFYLLSISENALSAFERRGLPIRNVFDSSFDDVLHISYLDFAGACGVLRQRVIGTPHPFLFLCYCISGGLPRDLIRVCRNLIIESQQRPDQSLAELCLAIVGADLLAKLHANEVVASDIPLERYVLNFLQELQSLRNAVAQVKLLSEPRRLAPDLRLGSDACFRPLPKLRGADDLAKKAFNDLRQLRYELAVYLAYLSIVVAFFTTEQVGESDFKTADSNGFFDDIAKVRQSLAINPALAEVLARQLADSSLPLPVRKPPPISVTTRDSGGDLRI